MIPPGAIVSTTGTVNLGAIQSLVHRSGAHYVVWSRRITHLIVGQGHATWKINAAKHLGAYLLHESDLPKPPTELWVDALKPKQLADVIGHTKEIATLTEWLTGTPSATTPRAVLITGPPGIGKTTTAHLVAKECGYEVTEFNASDERGAGAVREILARYGGGAAGAKHLLIMDEVDGMSSGDRGGAAEIAATIRAGRIRIPIICIANDRQSPKVKPIANVALDVRFSRPTKTTIAKQLLKRCPQPLAMDIAALETLVEQNGNDIRSVLNALQFATGATTTTTKDAILRMDPFSATGRIFSADATLDTATEAAWVDHALVPLMIAEGYLGAADKSRTHRSATDKLAAAGRAADCLSSWDLLDRRIHRQQEWGLLPHAVNAAVSAALIVDGPAPFQIFPTWLGKNSKTAKHRRLVADMARRCPTAKDADVRDALRTLLYSSELSHMGVMDTLDALHLTRDDMFDTLGEMVLKGFEETVAMPTKKKSAITREWKKRHPVVGSAASKAAEEADVGDTDDD